MAEISDTDLATYQRAMGLLKKLESDPKAKGHFETALKAVIPEIRTEADTVSEHVAPLLEPVNAQLTRIQESLDAQAAERTANAERQAEQNLTDQFASLRAKGLTDAGEQAVKELMVARNIADPEAAFALFERNNPKPADEAPAWQPDGWDISSTAKAAGMRDMEGLFKNEDKWGDDEAAIALNEIRIGKAA